ncbi:hypothetical protein M2280_000990 [Prescottella agglutinans]|uniref:HTH cro/C1-type domain-containing protein n=1 Tax=Prescottella agglutinans TaxID=1644129 RepID=A0ABT6M644_9NOCA|nr:hypothetical protein [Prescottella agglutinans]
MRLESGQRRATLELLLPLARTYDVPMDDLVGAPRTGDPRIHLKPIRRAGMIFVPLSRRPGGVQAFKMIIPAQPDPLEPTPQTHDGFEWLYVLNGLLILFGTHGMRAHVCADADQSPHLEGRR